MDTIQRERSHGSLASDALLCQSVRRLGFLCRAGRCGYCACPWKSGSGSQLASGLVVSARSAGPQPVGTSVPRRFDPVEPTARRGVIQDATQKRPISTPAESSRAKLSVRSVRAASLTRCPFVPGNAPASAGASKYLRSLPCCGLPLAWWRRDDALGTSTQARRSSRTQPETRYAGTSESIA